MWKIFFGLILSVVFLVEITVSRPENNAEILSEQFYDEVRQLLENKVAEKNVKNSKIKKKKSKIN